MKKCNVKVVKNGHAINLSAQNGDVLADVLVKNGIILDLTCGGNGKCGKCRAVCYGALSPIDVEEKHILNGEEENGFRLMCRTRVLGDVSVYIDEEKNTFTNEKYDVPQGFMCIDLGTTNVWVVYNTDGESKTAVFANPQKAFGADVISRISAYENGNGKQMEDLIKSAVSSVAENGIQKKIIFGNTAMQTIYAGKDPTSLGRSPYRVEDRFGRFIKNDYFAPCVGAFVGGDVCGGVYYAMKKGIIKEKTAIYADIGTNGEIVLIHNGRITACAAAAGPCFEGAGISCGMRSETGAIVGAYAENGNVLYKIFNAETPKGICGTGLIGIVSALLQIGKVSPSGLLYEEKYDLGGVYITRFDIRALQSAKAAIRAGIRILCKESAINESDIEKIYLSGAFGEHLDTSDAVRIGMLPNVGCQSLGNCALKGACLAAKEPRFIEELNAFSENITYIELSDSDDFTNEYIEALGF